MRKILFVSAAFFSGTVALAQAQPPANPSQGQVAAPYGAGPASNNNNNAWGIANTASGSLAAGPLSTEYAPNVVAVPTPGTIVTHLNGRVEVNVSANFSNLDRGVNANGTPNGFKVNPVGIGSFFRLYPGFDGVAANGLRYGASVELRENYFAGTTGTTNGGSTGSNSSPSGNTIPDDAHHFGQGLPQQRRFVAIVRRRHERRDHVALRRSQKATTLSPFTFLCPLKPRLSPPFFAAAVVPSP
ncbi:MAG: hypothetical protein QOF70_5438 [Acetobacteraceae bacterium]|nr:hypothetical protein [Acetobacteraceae bacterium]